MDCEDFDIDNLDESADFNQIINQIVEKQVNIQLQDKLGELEQLRKYKIDYHDLQRQIATLNQAHERELKKSIKEAKDEVKRSIFGGYKFGDTVYFCKDFGEPKKCETCGGSGNVTAKFNDREIKVTCPDCRYGNIYIKDMKPVKATIHEIKFHEWAKESCTELNFWVEPIMGETKELRIDRLFKTEDECWGFIRQKEKAD